MHGAQRAFVGGAARTGDRDMRRQCAAPGAADWHNWLRPGIEDGMHPGAVRRPSAGRAHPVCVGTKWRVERWAASKSCVVATRMPSTSQGVGVGSCIHTAGARRVRFSPLGAISLILRLIAAAVLAAALAFWCTAPSARLNHSHLCWEGLTWPLPTLQAFDHAPSCESNTKIIIAPSRAPSKRDHRWQVHCFRQPATGGRPADP